MKPSVSLPGVGMVLLRESRREERYARAAEGTICKMYGLVCDQVWPERCL